MDLHSVMCTSAFHYQSPLKSLSDCEISPFEPYNYDGLPQSFKKALSMINHMIELDYIELSECGSMSFSNSGIDYMFRCHRQFIQDIQGKDIDFGEFSGLIQELKEASKKGFGNDIVHRFNSMNGKLGQPVFEENEISYDNIRFSKKSDDSDEPMDNL